MTHLRSSRLKLCRAYKHIDSAKRAIKAFVESKPYTFTVEPYPKHPDYVIIANTTRAIGDELSLIVGDFAHNARSALNLLVYQLSKLADGDSGRMDLQFPIFDTPEGYRDHVKSFLAGVHYEHTAIILDSQPYQRPNGVKQDALSILSYINDTDKHRLIHACGAVAEYTGMSIFGPGRIGSNEIFGWGRSYQNWSGQ